jgi:arabinose-5-phosphate isomerase
MNDVGPGLRVVARIVENVQKTEAYEHVLKKFGTESRFHFTGVGKSGLTADRAAATWRSFGLDATYEHATELLHGGLGGLQGDVLFIMSHSGLTRECIEVAQAVTMTYTVAITSGIQSSLAAKCRRTITYGRVPDTERAHGLPIMVNYVQAAILDSIGLDFIDGWTKEAMMMHHPGGSIQ